MEKVYSSCLALVALRCAEERLFSAAPQRLFSAVALLSSFSFS